MASEFDLSARLKHINYADIVIAGNNMYDRVEPWVKQRYPTITDKLNLYDLICRNLAVFCEVQKYEEACKCCMSTDMCPTRDGNRMQCGRIQPSGFVKMWMERCPNGFKPPKGAIKQINEDVDEEWKPKAKQSEVNK